VRLHLLYAMYSHVPILTSAVKRSVADFARLNVDDGQLVRCDASR
jgi:hypothetical protein